MTRRKLINSLQVIFETQHEIDELEVLMMSATCDNHYTMNKLCDEFSSQTRKLKYLLFSLEHDIKGGN